MRQKIITSLLVGMFVVSASGTALAWPGKKPDRLPPVKAKITVTKGKFTKYIPFDGDPSYPWPLIPYIKSKGAFTDGSEVYAERGRKAGDRSGGGRGNK